MADFTVLDAPETPAPLFAFRALKSAIFGSPNDDDARNNKENAIQPKSAHTLRPKTSTFRAISVSPEKRRKVNQCASPAKSILRTPGIPTPRKQNINVTFKDVTPSLSPVLRRQENFSTKRPHLQVAEITPCVANLTATKTKAKSVEVAASSTQEPARHEQASRKADVTGDTISTFNFEAYRSSAEKEMKKLVRYGQKLREYARNQEQENTKLRIALERLQKENEELRRREDDRENSRLGHEKQSHRMKESQHSSVTDHKSESRSNTEPKPNNPPSKKQVDNKPAKSSAATRSSTLDMPTGNSQAQKLSSPLKRKASAQLMPESPLPKTSKSLVRSNIGCDTRSINAQLPLDRLAAARERVRRKAELRKATDANPSSPVNWDAL